MGGKQLRVSFAPKLALVLTALLGADTIALVVAFTTCLESRCADWHLWLDTVLFYVFASLLVLAVVAVCVAFVVERRHKAEQQR